VRLSNKDVSLELAPLGEKVENHWLIKLQSYIWFAFCVVLSRLSLGVAGARADVD